MLKDKLLLVTYLYIYIYIYILQIEPKLKEIFAERSILAFRRNKSLRDIIGGGKVFDNKKISNVRNLTKGNANHVSPDLLIYVVNNSNLA